MNDLVKQQSLESSVTPRSTTGSISQSFVQHPDGHKKVAQSQINQVQQKANEQEWNRYYGYNGYDYDDYYGETYDDLYNGYSNNQQLVYMKGYIAGYKAAHQKDKALLHRHDHKSILRKKYRN